MLARYLLYFFISLSYIVIVQYSIINIKWITYATNIYNGCQCSLALYLIHASHCGVTHRLSDDFKLANKITTDDCMISSFNSNLLNKESLNGFVEGGHGSQSGLFNGWKYDDNLAAMKNLLDQCEEVKIQRFIHVSTAVVVGRASDLKVTEKTLY